MRRAIIVVVVLAAIGASAYTYYQYTKKVEPPTVATAKVTRGDIAETVGATGTLQAVTTVQVGTQVSGTILQLNADFNSLVKKGQVLARLDPSLFQTQIEQARANLIRAEADLERLRVASDDARTKLKRAQELSKQRLIAQTELEAAEVAVRSAEAQLKSQQAAVTQSQASLRQNEVNLQHTVIESPIDGLVISRNVDVGQTVAASMSAPTLFVLAADLTKMQVLASLDESDVGRIRPGQLVHFRVDAYPNEDFTGQLTQVRLQPQTVQNVVTYSTVIDVPNPSLKLKPGMTANVNIEIARRADVLRIPNGALRFRPTPEIFEALGQTPPPTGGGRGRGAGGGNGAGQDSRLQQPAAPSAAATTSPATGTSGQSSVAASQNPRRAQQPSANASTQAPSRGEAAGPSRGQPAPTNDSTTAQAGNGNGAGGGRGQGGGGGRGNFQERLAAMTPEQREQFLERMRARGFTPPTELQTGTDGAADANAGRSGGTRSGAPGAAASGSSGQRRQSSQTATAAPPTAGGATTFDALFGPLPSTETFGQAWLYVGGKLQRVRLRLGVSDGQQTELIQALDGSIQEGTDLVTNITTAAQRQTPAPTGGNAFPGLGGGGRGPGGGFGGGGGGRGRGGG